MIDVKLDEKDVGGREVKENMDKLLSCPRHDFRPRIPMQRYYTCSQCGGRVDFWACAWYMKGLEHAEAIDAG